MTEAVSQHRLVEHGPEVGFLFEIRTDFATKASVEVKEIVKIQCTFVLFFYFKLKIASAASAMFVCFSTQTVLGVFKQIPQ